MLNTANYGLKKPDQTDNYNVQNQNDNMDIIDAQLKANADAAANAQATANAAETPAGAQAKVDALAGAGNTKTVKQLDDEVAAHLADDVNHVAYAADTGTANAKAVTLNPAPTAYVEGMALAFKNAAQNTGVVTINVNGLGAKTIKKANGNDVAAGNLKAGSIYTVRYNGTNFILQGEGGSGNATAADLLAGKTASTDAGDIVGTMPDNGDYSHTPTAAGTWLNPGYYNSLHINGDGKLVPDNVLQGKTIFGVTGTAPPLAKGSGTLSSQSSLTVSGLAFTPTQIRFTAMRAGAPFLFEIFTSGVGAAPNKTRLQVVDDTTDSASATVFGSALISIAGGSFTVTNIDTNYTSYDWAAW